MPKGAVKENTPFTVPHQQWVQTGAAAENKVPSSSLGLHTFTLPGQIKFKKFQNGHFRAIFVHTNGLLRKKKKEMRKLAPKKL